VQLAIPFTSHGLIRENGKCGWLASSGNYFLFLPLLKFDFKNNPHEQISAHDKNWISLHMHWRGKVCHMEVRSRSLSSHIYSTCQSYHATPTGVAI
jgi:hypothetical protein